MNFQSEVKNLHGRVNTYLPYGQFASYTSKEKEKSVFILSVLLHATIL